MKSLLNALVIDDDPQIRGLVASLLQDEGWSVEQAGSAEDAFTHIGRLEWDLVFCDVIMGGADGYEVLRRFTEEQPKARVVLMTGHGSAAGALDATSTGAHDYLVKPFSVGDVTSIASVVKERSSRVPGKKKNTDDEGYISDLPLIGRSPKFVECMKVVGRVAGTTLPVLITGESGTGKEVVARAIHQRSTRSSGPFITVNCGALPNELISAATNGRASCSAPRSRGRSVHSSLFRVSVDGRWSRRTACVRRQRLWQVAVFH